MSETINLVSARGFDGNGFPCSPDRVGARERAFTSWARIGATVTYVVHPGHILWGELAREAMRYAVAAQIDEDIVLNDGIRRVFKAIRDCDPEKPAWATSLRRSFNRGQDPELGVFGDDYGLSIFVGNKAWWNEVANSGISRFSKLGVFEDNAVCGFGNQFHRDMGHDFTPSLCVMHERHESAIYHERKHYNVDALGKLEFPFEQAGLPEKKIR